MSLRLRRILILIGSLLLVSLLLWRPGANRLRGRLQQSISMALGRQVEIGGVSLRFLPRPGFELSNFVVHDDPHFSAEPILRAEEVTAVLHPSSLWRWRMEIARLSFKEPSLNLVRLQDGRWNLETILERATHAQAAPTSKPGSETRPRFPYVEADNGRINLKLGMEKKAFTLTEADFAIWLESENEWGMRLLARPMRTDMALSDTGTFQVTGAWKRNVADAVPVSFAVSLQDAQLGQLTKLLTGNDLGWRGAVSLQANVTGKVAEAQVQLTSSIDDFRRYDIFVAGSRKLEAQCSATYTRAQQEFSSIACQPPGDSPVWQLSGNAVLQKPVSYDLQLDTSRLPLQVWVEVLRRIKKGIPGDLVTQGVIDARARFTQKGGEQAQWSGGGEATGVILHSTSLENDLDLGTIPLRLTSSEAAPRAKPHAKSSPPDFTVPACAVEVGAFTVPIGKKSQAQAHAWFSPQGYGLSFAGSGPLQRVLQLARTAAVPVSQPAVEGDATFDLRSGGTWDGFAPPIINGTLQIANLRTEVRGLNAPLMLKSANLSLDPQRNKLENISASLAGMQWTGSIAWRRQCPAEKCDVQVDLHADEVASDTLNQLLNPNLRKRPWYRLLTGPASSGPSPLNRFVIRGTISADRLLLRDLALNHAAAEIVLDQGTLTLSHARAETLGGKVSGDWQIAFHPTPPSYSGSGKLEGISLALVGKLMREDWISGSGDANYKVAFSGWGAPEMRTSATAILNFDAHAGVLNHVKPDGHTPVRFQRFQGSLVLADASFTVKEGKLQNPDGIYSVEGTASLARDLRLTLLRNAGAGFSVNGTLAAPHLKAVTANEEQARKAR